MGVNGGRIFTSGHTLTRQFRALLSPVFPRFQQVFSNITDFTSPRLKWLKPKFRGEIQSDPNKTHWVCSHPDRSNGFRHKFQALLHSNIQQHSLEDRKEVSSLQQKQQHLQPGLFVRISRGRTRESCSLYHEQVFSIAAATHWPTEKVLQHYAPWISMREYSNAIVI